jgi:uncharacterized protein YndB with AHSA1/START domain
MSITFSFSHSHDTTAPAEAVWALYSDVATWPDWDQAAERVTLDGDFAGGTCGTLQLHGQEPLEFALTEVEPQRAFTDETALPGGAIRFRHTLAPLEDGRLRLTHAVEIDADAAVAEQLGPVITAGVPATMAALARLAEERSA